MKTKEQANKRIDFPLGKENFKILIISLIIIVLGYILMSGGASKDPNVFNENEVYSFRRITLAPIIVLIGYILAGYAIMKKPKDNNKD